MPDMSQLIQNGSANVFFLILSALILGALHGLEPGHSKTMMAAFIVAVRGTVWQAVLLALAATVSHTAIVWIVALVGMHFGAQWNAESTEPYLQVASGVFILLIAFWMLYRIWQNQKAGRLAAQHEHHHGEEIRRVDTGHGIVALEVFEKGVLPRWRLRSESGHSWPADEVKVETKRPDGKRQIFLFVNRGGYLESIDEIPEPHEFTARLSLGHAGHTHDYDLEFNENHHHEHLEGLDVSSGEYEDAHARAHANDIKRRFADQHVTTGQIILFGLTGGLIPCGAAITVLLLCLQLKKFFLGVLLVLCFSIGLAATLMVSGAVAAWGVRHVGKRLDRNPLFARAARYAPYLSSFLVILVGLYVTWSGFRHLP
jgi:nickel/cobalt exporter